MKVIAESNIDDRVINTLRQSSIEEAVNNMKLFSKKEAVGVLIMNMEDIDDIIRQTHGPDTDLWFSLSEEERQACATRLIRNVFDGVKDQIEYAIADNFAAHNTSKAELC